MKNNGGRYTDERKKYVIGFCKTFNILALYAIFIVNNIEWGNISSYFFNGY